jgi:hypothetical protein
MSRTHQPCHQPPWSVHLALLLFLAALGPAPLLSAATWLTLAAAIPWLAKTTDDQPTTAIPR